MDSVDFSVLKAAKEWANGDLPTWLITVVETFGSSPRPVGAMLVLRSDGLSVGSVSGGCIEDDLIDKARTQQLSIHHATQLTYGVTREEALAFGLPCGGTLSVVIEPIKDATWLDEILKLIGEHRLVSRSLRLSDLNIQLSQALPDEVLSFDGDTLITVHGPRWRLLIIGAGQTSTYLAQMAQALDYEIFICDPREEFRTVWDVSGTTVLSGMPDDVVLEMDVDSRTAIIALTHDPKLDDMALLEALKSPAFYVGALGSKLNNEKRRDRLALFDLAPDEIARLHGPVGLNIHSRTPPEIAVAILAHIISVKNQMISANTKPSKESHVLA